MGAKKKTSVGLLVFSFDRIRPSIFPYALKCCRNPGDKENRGKRLRSPETSTQETEKPGGLCHLISRGTVRNEKTVFSEK